MAEDLLAASRRLGVDTRDISDIQRMQAPPINRLTKDPRDRARISAQWGRLRSDQMGQVLEEREQLAQFDRQSTDAFGRGEMVRTAQQGREDEDLRRQERVGARQAIANLDPTSEDYFSQVAAIAAKFPEGIQDPSVTAIRGAQGPTASEAMRERMERSRESADMWRSARESAQSIIDGYGNLYVEKYDVRLQALRGDAIEGGIDPDDPEVATRLVNQAKRETMIEKEDSMERLALRINGIPPEFYERKYKNLTAEDSLEIMMEWVDQNKANDPLLRVDLRTRSIVRDEAPEPPKPPTRASLIKDLSGVNALLLDRNTPPEDAEVLQELKKGILAQLRQGGGDDVIGRTVPRVVEGAAAVNTAAPPSE